MAGGLSVGLIERGRGRKEGMSTIDATAEELARQGAANLARQRALDLIADARHQLDEATRLLYAGDPAVASALVIRLPKAVELIDVSGITITATRLRQRPAYGGPGVAQETPGGTGEARRPPLRRRHF